MECSRCKKTSTNLKRCKGCYTVSYCSKICQRTDWPDHKKFCKTASFKEKSVPRIDTDKNKLQSDPTSLYGKAEDVTNENKDVPESYPEESSSQSQEESSEQNKCHLCGKTAQKKCSRCKTVFYCSKQCQKNDWAHHKRSCLRPDQQEETRPLIPNPFCNPLFSPFSPFNQFLQGPNLSTIATTTDEAFNRAIQLARQKYPFQEVICILDEIPSEQFFFRPQTNDVLVAFIPRYHHYRARHCIYIRDKQGEETYVAFYLDFDNPFPFFSWESVRPGRFIAIENPCIHYFMDGSVGLRIEDPSDVRFIDV